MNTKTPKFIKCLYTMLHTEDTNILSWSADGEYFQIHDVSAMERTVLPRYFKHAKFASFQRQLNNFGFRKWTKTRAAVCTFSHQVYVRCNTADVGILVARAARLPLSLTLSDDRWKTTTMSTTVSHKRQRPCTSPTIDRIAEEDTSCIKRHKTSSLVEMMDTPDMDQVSDVCLLDDWSDTTWMSILDECLLFTANDFTLDNLQDHDDTDLLILECISSDDEEECDVSVDTMLRSWDALLCQ